jgi:hypothetical protein
MVFTIMNRLEVTLEDLESEVLMKCLKPKQGSSRIAALIIYIT